MLRAVGTAGFFLLILAGCGIAGATDIPVPPELYTFNFRAATSVSIVFRGTGSVKTLSGLTPKECNVQGSPVFDEDELVGDLGIAETVGASNNCWDARYAHSNFDVQQGEVSAPSFRGIAYKVWPPALKATQWQSSGQRLHMRLNESTSYTVYRLESGIPIEVSRVDTSSSPSAQGFVSLGDAFVHGLTIPTIYVVLPADTDVPPTTQRTIGGRDVKECDSPFEVKPIATLGSIALILKRGNSGSCWADNRYSSADFLVETGKIAGSDGSARSAYRLHPPQIRPTDFTASDTAIYYKATSTQRMHVHELTGTTWKKLADFDATEGQWVNTGVTAHGLTQPGIYYFAAATERVSNWPLASSSVEFGTLAESDWYRLSGRRFSVGAPPFDPYHQWVVGPGEHSGNYGFPKQFFPVTRADGREGVVWQQQDSKAIQATWLAPDLLSSETFEVFTGGYHLHVAVSNAADDIVLVLFSMSTPADKYAGVDGLAVRVSSRTGQEKLRKSLDTSQSGLNFHSHYSSGSSGAWDVQANTIGMHISRTMTRSGDNINHQGAISIILDPTTLDVIKNYGQISSHTFQNSLVRRSNGGFVGFDYGDMYPRGPHLWTFGPDPSDPRKSWHAVKVKRAHSKDASGGYDPYPEITPSGGPQYYKHSGDDNRVYGELGHPGVIELSDAYLYFIVVEKPLLDNSQVGQVLNAPRNIAYIKVGKDLSSHTVLSPGPIEVGGYYRQNQWVVEENYGVTYVTDYTNIEDSVSRLKTLHLGNGSILLFWEAWSRDTFQETRMMVFDESMTLIKDITPVGFPVRLGLQDDPLNSNGTAIFYTGTQDNQLVRFEVCFFDCPQREAGNSVVASSTSLESAITMLSPNTALSPNTTLRSNTLLSSTSPEQANATTSLEVASSAPGVAALLPWTTLVAGLTRLPACD